MIQKIKQKLLALFPKASLLQASLLLAASFLAIAIFLSMVIVGLQTHGRYERQQELNEKGVTEANLREIERQGVRDKINDLKTAAIRALVPIVVLLAFWLLFKYALKLFKVMRKWIIEEWDRCTGRPVDPSAQKTGFRKFLNIFALIVMILVVLLQVALALFVCWISTGPSSGGSIMGGMGAFAIGAFANMTYWIGTLGGLLLLLLLGQWRCFFRTFCIWGVTFLLFLLLAPGLAMVFLVSLSYGIFQITWALQHFK